MIEPIGYLVVGLFAIGMGVSFLSADPRSPTSRALSFFFILLGVVSAMNLPAYGRFFGESELLWYRLFSLAEIGVLTSGFEWILRVERTMTSAPSAVRTVWTLRAAQALAFAYGLIGAIAPGFRNAYWNVPWSGGPFLRPQYYVFAVPFVLSLAFAAVRLIHIVRAELDPAERLRLNAMSCAAPFWCAGLFLSPTLRPVSFAIGEVIFLVGAIRYHVLQGHRGQFLARFVSPQVVHVVRERGLSSMARQSRVELSVVACDLRGFTAFTETAAPEEIMTLLDAYYRAVGEAVSRGGGSINNFAGDGIMALVGAPIVYHDHAQRAVAIALAIREQTRATFAHWNSLGLQLGLGIGIATGFVTVGVIGGPERLEYAAVGPAMNLAARLCSRADAGQILADQRVVGSVGEAPDGYRFERLTPAELKGFARPVAIFAVMSAGDTRAA
jgi:class 3 adenylate cyclase